MPDTVSSVRRSKRAPSYVADDDIDFLRPLRRILVDAGATVDCVKSGEEALAAITTRHYHLLLLDLRLEGLSGHDVLRVLRERRVPLKVIVLTGTGPGDDAAGEALRLGADHYLTKPITADDLLCATRDTLAAPWARLCWDPPPAPVGSTGNAVRATNASAHAWCTEVIETLRGERDDWRFQIAGRLGLYIAIHRPAIPESITIMRCVRSVCAAKALDDDLIRRLDVDLVPASPAVSRARHRHVIWLIDRFEKPSGATRFRIS